MSIFNRSSTLKQSRAWFHKNHEINDYVSDSLLWIVILFNQNHFQQNSASIQFSNYINCQRQYTLPATTLSEGMEYCHAA